MAGVTLAGSESRNRTRGSNLAWQREDHEELPKLRGIVDEREVARMQEAPSRVPDLASHYGGHDARKEEEEEEKKKRRFGQGHRGYLFTVQ